MILTGQLMPFWYINRTCRPILHVVFSSRAPQLASSSRPYQQALFTQKKSLESTVIRAISGSLSSNKGYFAVINWPQTGCDVCSPAGMLGTCEAVRDGRDVQAVRIVRGIVRFVWEGVTSLSAHTFAIRYHRVSQNSGIPGLNRNTWPVGDHLGYQDVVAIIVRHLLCFKWEPDIVPEINIKLSIHYSISQ